ncbi:MAG: hypothetical protein U5N53_14085 [Mycobacterium sp.]|nr:hypothetical protein [Mycobacterium sp.]
MARFADLLAMFGIDAVTPDVAITSSGGTPIGDTGLALGGANLVPVKIDLTVEYQLMPDFAAAWANPVTLLNNVVAGLLPTYMLRGVDIAGAAEQPDLLSPRNWSAAWPTRTPPTPTSIGRCGPTIFRCWNRST